MFDFPNETTAPVAPSNVIRLRNNAGTLESSSSAGPYVPVAGGGTSPWTAVGTVVELVTPTNSVLVQSGQISSPGAGSSSEQFGLGAVAGANSSLAVGASASATGTLSTVFGQGASDGGFANATVVGQGSSALAQYGAVYGQNSTVGYNSVTVGPFNSNSGQNSVVVGANISNSDNNCVFAGQGITLDSGNVGNSVVVGSGANASATGTVVLGANATASNTGGGGAIAIGNFANAASDICVAIGQFVYAGGPGSIAIGFEASTSSFSNTIALGVRGTATAPNQISAGHINAEFTNAYFGGGVNYPGTPFVSYRTTPPTPDFMLHGTNGLFYSQLGAPVNPPTLSNTPAGSSLTAGTYTFAYSYRNKDDFGETGLSSPTAITISDGDSITITPSPTIPNGTGNGQYQDLNFYLDNPPGSGSNFQSIGSTFSGPLTITSYTYGNNNDSGDSGDTNDSTGTSGNGYRLQLAGGMGDVSGIGGNIEFYTGRTPNTLTLAGYFNAPDGTLSVPGSGTFSEQFGLGASAINTNDTAVGHGANTFSGFGGDNAVFGYNAFAEGSGTGGCTVLGSQASITLSDYATAVGFKATTNGASYSTAVGAFSYVSQSYSVVVGESASCYSDSSIAIGYTASVNGGASGGIAIGYQSTVASTSDAIAIGRYSNNMLPSGSVSSNSFACGSGPNPIIDVWFGSGSAASNGTSLGSNATVDWTLHGSDAGSSTFPDGSNLKLQGGLGFTSTDTAGGIRFLTGLAGSASSPTLVGYFDGPTGYLAVGQSTQPYSTVDVQGSLGLLTQSTAVTPTTLTSAAEGYIFDTSAGPIIVNLPDATTCPNRVYDVKKAGATPNTNSLTLTPFGAQTINRAPTLSWTEDLQSFSIRSDGSNWWTFGGGTAGTFVKVNAGTTGQYASTEFALTTGATIALDWNNGNAQFLTLQSGTNTFTPDFVNGLSGGRYILRLVQPSTGSPGYVTWPTNVLWSAGVAPVLSTTNSKTDIVTLYMGADGNFYGNYTLNY